MFSSLSSKLTAALDALRKRGVLSEADIDRAMGDIRLALLDADVALPVVGTFIESLKTKAVGAEVARSVSPGQMVVKLVNDHLVELLGGAQAAELNLNAAPPVVILMCGLQGSGKTTTSGKLAHRLATKQHKKVLLASLDVYRPAAQLQLQTLAEQAGVASLAIVEAEKPLAITRRALEKARLEGFDALIFDTAGRLHVDDALMQELQEVKALARPLETLLVADALTGQDAVNVAAAFHEKIGLSGIVLTRVDGDGRGGAALSMRAVTGQPIKFVGVGEKLDALEPFHPERIASRILDMGDVVSLVEKAIETVDQAEAEKAARKFQEGTFDLDDLLAQLRQMKKMGGLGAMMGMLPGIGKLQDKLANANVDEKMLARQEAIILSMTPQERKNPKILGGGRKIRIAKGSGTQVQDVNRLYKQYLQMHDAMKTLSKMNKKGMMQAGLKQLFG